MDQRMYKILEAVVDEYIRTGEPVGSKTVMHRLDISISSATIRNEMAALEQMGYLEHPHTSAGRIPTYKGYKHYIENSMQHFTLTEDEKEEVDRVFETLPSETDEILIESASRALADFTKCAIVTANAVGRFSVITKVDVIPTGKRMYVILLITSGGNIKNKACRLSFDLTDEQMEFFTKFVNENLSGVNLESLSKEYMEKLTMALGNYMLALSPLIQALQELSEELQRHHINLEGEENLIVCEEFHTKEVVDLLQKKNQFSQLMDHAFSGINVVFGPENDTIACSNSSIITGTFKKGNEPVGGFGAIGPMRLDYKKIIPYIDYFTKKVTNRLSEQDEDTGFKALTKEADSKHE